MQSSSQIITTNKPTPNFFQHVVVAALTVSKPLKTKSIVLQDEAARLDMSNAAGMTAAAVIVGLKGY